MERRTFEQGYLEIWRPYGLCLAFQRLPALTAGDNGMAVGVTFVTWGEHVERVLDVGHGRGGGRRTMEMDERKGGGLYISGGGGCLSYSAGAMSLLNMCDGVSRLGSDKEMDKLTFGHLRLPLAISISPPASQPVPGLPSPDSSICPVNLVVPTLSPPPLADSLLVHSTSSVEVW